MVTKAQKGEIVSKIKEQTSDASIAFLANFSELSVAQITDLRRSLGEVGKCLVVKNTLAGRALEGSEFENLKPFLTGPSLLVLGKGEAPSTVKAFFKFKKGLEGKLEVKGGVIPGEVNVLDAKALQQLADLPPREVLLAQIAGLLTSTPSQIVNTINQTISSIGDLSVKIAEKNEAK